MLQKQFEHYLTSLGVSRKTIRNYRSDLSHFIQWSILRLKTVGSYIEDLSELIPFLTNNFVSDYKIFMSENASPERTINRRLSTLRQLSRFLIHSQIINGDFMSDIQNVGLAKKQARFSLSLISDFTNHLESQKVSQNTIKNYQSDIRQFLTWLENNHARFA